MTVINFVDTLIKMHPRIYNLKYNCWELVEIGHSGDENLIIDLFPLSCFLQGFSITSYIRLDQKIRPKSISNTMPAKKQMMRVDLHVF